MRKFLEFVKWLVRVAIAVDALFLIGAAVAVLYKESAPTMYTWFANAMQNIFQ